MPSAMTAADSTEFFVLYSQRSASFSGSFSSETPVCVALPRCTAQSPAYSGSVSANERTGSRRRRMFPLRISPVKNHGCMDAHLTSGPLECGDVTPLSFVSLFRNHVSKSETAKQKKAALH